MKRWRWGDDRGSALLVVLVTMTVLTVMVTVGLSQSVSSIRQSDRAGDWKQALAAAEAGVDDYLARLNRYDGYWQTTDCNNVALKGAPKDTGLASGVCSWNAATKRGWVAVDGEPDAFFSYKVDVSETDIDGTIVFTSSGRVGDVVRTVRSILRRGGFGEFLYYTVYETVDPANQAVYGTNNSTAQTRCTRYRWGSPARDTSYCSDIQFGAADRINGPLHTNDTMIIEGGARFTGTTTTSNPACRSETGVAVDPSKCYIRKGSGTPTFTKGITYRPEIDLPTTIGNLRQYVTPGQVTSARLGCLYTGPTRIKFFVTGGVSKMTVWSYYSGRSGGPTLNANCGTAAALQSTAGATLNFPDQKLVMVQDVPQAQSTPSSGACAAGRIGDGLPVANDYNLQLAEANCRYGTLYVEGVVKGRATLSVDNNIVITDNLTYSGGENGLDALGLIAGNSVQIYHPVELYCASYNNKNQCTSYSLRNMKRNNDRAVLTNVTVNAAILTLQHSFTVQYYNYGASLGVIKVFGSIAQRFRGPVGLSSGQGYDKNYNYDTRLRYAPPPYFLDPVKSGWGQKTFGEVPTTSS